MNQEIHENEDMNIHEIDHEENQKNEIVQDM